MDILNPYPRANLTAVRPHSASLHNHQPFPYSPNQTSSHYSTHFPTHPPNHYYVSSCLYSFNPTVMLFTNTKIKWLFKVAYKLFTHTWKRFISFDKISAWENHNQYKIARKKGFDWSSFTFYVEGIWNVQHLLYSIASLKQRNKYLCKRCVVHSFSHKIEFKKCTRGGTETRKTVSEISLVSTSLAYDTWGYGNIISYTIPSNDKTKLKR